MTAWTVLIILMCVMTQCSLDLIGLEYGSDSQFLTDIQFRFVALGCIFMAFCVDMVNTIRRIGERNEIKLRLSDRNGKSTGVREC